MNWHHGTIEVVVVIPQIDTIDLIRQPWVVIIRDLDFIEAITAEILMGVIIRVHHLLII